MIPCLFGNDTFLLLVDTGLVVYFTVGMDWESSGEEIEFDPCGLLDGYCIILIMT